MKHDIDEKLQICKVCGLHIRDQRDLERVPNCFGRPLIPTNRTIHQSKMNTGERLLSFSKALFEFAKGHGEFLPKDKIKERLDICSKCPHFTGNHCNICGCGVGPEQKLMNKLAHPMTYCPDKPPRWGKCDTTTQDTK